MLLLLDIMLRLLAFPCILTTKNVFFVTTCKILHVLALCPQYPEVPYDGFQTHVATQGTGEGGSPPSCYAPPSCDMQSHGPFLTLVLYSFVSGFVWFSDSLLQCTPCCYMCCSVLYSRLVHVSILAQA